MSILRDLALGDDVFCLFGDSPKMCDLHAQWVLFDGAPATQSVMYTFTFNFKKSKDNLMHYSRSCRKHYCKHLWKELALVYLPNVVGRAFSALGIITRTWRRTWKILVSCGRSKLNWSAPPFSKQIEIASILLGHVFFSQEDDITLPRLLNVSVGNRWLKT